jgi:hypothetical protein
MDGLLTIVVCSSLRDGATGADGMLVRILAAAVRPPQSRCIVAAAADAGVPEATPPAEISPNFRPHFGFFGCEACRQPVGFLKLYLAPGGSPRAANHRPGR